MIAEAGDSQHLSRELYVSWAGDDCLSMWGVEQSR